MEQLFSDYHAKRSKLLASKHTILARNSLYHVRKTASFLRIPYLPLSSRT